MSRWLDQTGLPTASLLGSSTSATHIATKGATLKSWGLFCHLLIHYPTDVDFFIFFCHGIVSVLVSSYFFVSKVLKTILLLWWEEYLWGFAPLWGPVLPHQIHPSMPYLSLQKKTFPKLFSKTLKKSYAKCVYKMKNWISDWMLNIHYPMVCLNTFDHRVLFLLLLLFHTILCGSFHFLRVPLTTTNCCRGLLKFHVAVAYCIINTERL